jgi:hypothetical protein
VHTMLGGPLYVAEDTLDESPMGITPGVHVEASLIDDVGDVLAHKGEVLKCPDNAEIEGGGVPSLDEDLGQVLGMACSSSCRRDQGPP